MMLRLLCGPHGCVGIHRQHSHGIWTILQLCYGL